MLERLLAGQENMKEGMLSMNEKWTPAQKLASKECSL
jgi:hypothetical protein